MFAIHVFREELYMKKVFSIVAFVLLITSCSVSLFTPSSFVVKFDLNYAGAMNGPSDQTVKAGEKLAVPVSPSRSAFSFGGWFREALCATEWNFNTDTVSADQTLYAKWTAVVIPPMSYTVTFNLNYAGFSGGPSSQTITSGSFASLPPAPLHTGYTFDAWYQEAVCASEWNFTVNRVTADTTLFARWTAVGGPVPSFEENFSGPLNSAIWQVAGWQEHGGQTSPERCFTKDGYLNMIFINDPSLTPAFRSAALQTKQSFLYGLWETRLKPTSVPGILNSFYTIDWNDGNGTKQEIDIEFLTYTFGPGKGKIHFAVHASGLTSFNLNPDIELGFNPSDDFHVYGYDITPERIQWKVDGKVLYTYTYAGNDITINSPYQLKLNVWSATGWVNGPPPANTTATYQIDWIKFYAH